MSRIGNTVAEGVAERLRAEIRSGAIRPGEYLRQNIVAERLGVSSTPVREAFSILEGDGMVRREARRGVVVFEPTVEDLLDCYEIREVLETLAARRAAKRLTKRDLDWLSEIAAQMTATTEDVAEYVRLNQAFHERIERAAGSKRLLELIAAQRAAAATYLFFLGLKQSTAVDTVDEHRAIVDALATGRADAAGMAMSRHIRARAAALRDRLLSGRAAEATEARPNSARRAASRG